MYVVLQHVFMCLLVFSPSSPLSLFHTVLLDASLSFYRPLIIPWTRLLGTNLVFLPSLCPPLPLLSATACTWTKKYTKPPPHHTGTTNCCIPLQWILCPTFPPVHSCCQKNAGLHPAPELNWSRKLFHCNKRLMITAVMRPYCTCQDEFSPLP